MRIYFDKCNEPVDILVVNEKDLRRQILKEMQSTRKVITAEKRISGEMIIVDTSKIQMVV